MTLQVISPDDLKKIREERHLNKSRIALVSGVTPITISRIEQGVTKNPSPETMAKLTKAILDLSKDDSNLPKYEFKKVGRPSKKATPENNLTMQSVRAYITFTTVAEVILDVNEQVVSKNPLKTERTYTNPRSMKVISNSYVNNDFEIKKILSENVLTEVQPAYVK